MTAWEYRFIELFHRPEYQEKGSPVERATHLVTDDLDEAGREGWEAVGEVTILSGSITHPVILMKRPVDHDRTHHHDHDHDHDHDHHDHDHQHGDHDDD
ncbi:MAG: hypothetical protein U0P45_09175 [Acidimicrobiales bacterium]